MCALAHRSGAWILVERRGIVLGHAPGSRSCPDPAAQALLHKTIKPLRDAVGWRRGSVTSGTLHDQPIQVEHLSAHATAWAIGCQVPVALTTLRAVLPDELPTVQDALVAQLLETEAFLGKAPIAKLMAVISQDTDRLCRELSAALTGSSARIHHSDDDLALVAVDPSTDVQAVLRLLRPGRAIATGVAVVPDGAPDWVGTYRLAVAAAGHARRLGLPIADVADAHTAAQLVLDAAAEAATALAGNLHFPPLARLREHDARHGGDLLDTLATWCRHGHDNPAAAAAMHVHVNTLRYRVRRAGEIAGVDLTCPHQLLALQVLTHRKSTEHEHVAAVS